LRTLCVHEDLRDRGLLHYHDRREELQRSPGKMIFFSHQWTAFGAPDHTDEQYQCMVAAMKHILNSEGWSVRQTWIWVDYISIPQRCRGMQLLAIHSLATYASCADAFVIVAPAVVHDGTALPLSMASYNQRMWCRTENLCHSLCQGSGAMWLSTSTSHCAKLSDDTAFLRSNLYVFEGEATVEADKIDLVLPILGLYAELYALMSTGDDAYSLGFAESSLRKTIRRYSQGGDLPPETIRRSASTSMADMLRIHRKKKNTSAKREDPAFRVVAEELCAYRARVFPRELALKRKGADGVEEKCVVPLFGELVDKMEEHIDSDQDTRRMLMRRWEQRNEIRDMATLERFVIKMQEATRLYQARKLANSIGRKWVQGMKSQGTKGPGKHEGMVPNVSIVSTSPGPTLDTTPGATTPAQPRAF